MSDHSILFLQEHWLSDSQSQLFDELSVECRYASVSGFEGTEVLHGRPYGGCAILWRHGALQNVVRLEVNSSRIVAVTCSIGCTMLLLINVYLPCDNDSTFADFAFELSVCETLINEYDDHDIVIGGDFNIDLARISANTVFI
jgi:exonuclease III